MVATVTVAVTVISHPCHQSTPSMSRTPSSTLVASDLPPSDCDISERATVSSAHKYLLSTPWGPNPLPGAGDTKIRRKGTDISREGSREAAEGSVRSTDFRAIALAHVVV